MRPDAPLSACGVRHGVQVAAAFIARRLHVQPSESMAEAGYGRPDPPIRLQAFDRGCAALLRWLADAQYRLPLGSQEATRPPQLLTPMRSRDRPDEPAGKVGSSGGKMIFHMFGALAGFERNVIREPIQAGLITAHGRARNRSFCGPTLPASVAMSVGTPPR